VLVAWGKKARKGGRIVVTWMWRVVGTRQVQRKGDVLIINPQIVGTTRRRIARDVLKKNAKKGQEINGW